MLHGEGESRADDAEAETISAIFGCHKPWGLATKGIFGHLWGGSPALDLIMALRALAEGGALPAPGMMENLFRGAAHVPGRDELQNALVLLQGFDGVCAGFVVGKNA